MLHIKLRGKKYRQLRSKHFDHTHIPDLLVRLKSDIEVVQISLFFIELTTGN